MGEALRTKSVVMIFISHILSSALDHEVYQEHCCAVLIINLVHNTMTIIYGWWWWTLGWSAVSDSIFPSVLWIWDDWDEGSNKTLNSLHDNRTLVTMRLRSHRQQVRSNIVTYCYNCYKDQEGNWPPMSSGTLASLSKFDFTAFIAGKFWRDYVLTSSKSVPPSPRHATSCLLSILYI